MGVGGGFVMVPAMIYIFRWEQSWPLELHYSNCICRIKCSILHATFNYSVDLILAIFLLIGGVIGAQYGSSLLLNLR